MLAEETKRLRTDYPEQQLPNSPTAVNNGASYPAAMWAAQAAAARWGNIQHPPIKQEKNCTPVSSHPPSLNNNNNNNTSQQPPSAVVTNAPNASQSTPPPLTNSPLGGGGSAGGDSPYSAGAAAAGGFFGGQIGGVNTEALYETMTQNYQSLSHTLGKNFILEHGQTDIHVTNCQTNKHPTYKVAMLLKL